MERLIVNPLTRQGIVVNDCGTGSGGFKPGNSCAKGGGSSAPDTGGTVDKLKSGLGPSWKVNAEDYKDGTAAYKLTHPSAPDRVYQWSSNKMALKSTDSGGTWKRMTPSDVNLSGLVEIVKKDFHRN